MNAARKKRINFAIGFGIEDLLSAFPATQEIQVRHGDLPAFHAKQDAAMHRLQGA
jgi:hypothetical protein